MNIQWSWVGKGLSEISFNLILRRQIYLLEEFRCHHNAATSSHLLQEVFVIPIFVSVSTPFIQSDMQMYHRSLAYPSLVFHLLTTYFDLNLINLIKG
jgi:hypothetical protein